MDDIFSELCRQIDLEIDKDKKNKVVKTYKPTSKKINQIGTGKDFIETMIKISYRTLQYSFFNSLRDDFENLIGIKDEKVVLMNEISKVQIESFIMKELNNSLTRASETFYSLPFKKNVYPLYRRLEFLYSSFTPNFITDGEYAEIMEAYKIYFHYLLKTYLDLPTDEFLIKQTYFASLAICKPSYSKHHESFQPLTFKFISSFTSGNAKMNYTLLGLALAWYQKHRPFKVENLEYYHIGEFTFLLSNAELLTLKLKYLHSLNQEFDDYKKGVLSNPKPNDIRTTISEIRTWTNDIHLLSISDPD